MNTHRLVDGDTGPLHSLASTNLHRFLAWNRTKTQPVIYSEVWISTSSIITVQCCTALLQLSYTTDRSTISHLRDSTSNSGTPFFETSYDYSNNEILMNSDSQLRNVSLSIISNTDNIQLLFIDIVFTNTVIDWILLSEVDICEGNLYSCCKIPLIWSILSGPPNAIPVFEPVAFQGGQSETVKLGPNSLQSSIRLSCTVAVSGSFQWTWEHNGDSLLSSERYQILTGDATRSSILVINKLNYTDEGTYSCVVNHVSRTETTSKLITLQLLGMLLHDIPHALQCYFLLAHYMLYVAAINATAKQISVREGEAVIVSCEMYGYLRGEIEWLKDGQQVQSGGRYSITVSAGSREGQDGGESSVSSVVSQLTIQQVEQGDEGTYTCTAVGSTLQERIYVNITTVGGKHLYSTPQLTVLI